MRGEGPGRELQDISAALVHSTSPALAARTPQGERDLHTGSKIIWGMGVQSREKSTVFPQWGQPKVQPATEQMAWASAGHSLALHPGLATL